MRFGLVAFVVLLGSTATPVLAEPRAFIAVETRDIAAAEAWYGRTFSTALVSTTSRPAFEQRILRGEDMIVELVQQKPPMEPVAEGAGFMKAGVVIDDLDERLVRWRAEGVTFLGHRVHDAALDFDAVLLRDPDGNLIQVYGKRRGRP